MQAINDPGAWWGLPVDKAGDVIAKQTHCQCGRKPPMLVVVEPRALLKESA